MRVLRWFLCAEKAAAAASGTEEDELEETTDRDGEEDLTADPSKGKCQAVGCDAPLDNKYSFKRRLCREHLKADAILRKRGGTELWRFCQQCGKLEPLSVFEGNKRCVRVRAHVRIRPLFLLACTAVKKQSLPGMRASGVPALNLTPSLCC